VFEEQLTFTWFLFLINGNPGKLKYRGRVLYAKVMIMNRMPCSRIVRIIMASVFEISKVLVVLWFGTFQFLRFVFFVIRKYKYEYYKKLGKHDENFIGGVKRKD